jgi:hypothetical protein
VWHEVHLKLQGIKWSEKITVSKATRTGNAGGIITTFHPSCGSGCQIHAGGGLATPFTLNGSAHTGSADHTFTVSAGHPRSSHTRYEFDFKKPGYARSPGCRDSSTSSPRHYGSEHRERSVPQVPMGAPPQADRCRRHRAEVVGEAGPRRRPGGCAGSRDGHVAVVIRPGMDRRRRRSVP